MKYVGIDIHKRYSVLVAVDERGWELARGRINGNTAFGFAQFFAGLEGPSKVVLEACWNWGRIYDLLSEIGQVEEVVLAHPLKTRLIADAQIKTDGLDGTRPNDLTLDQRFQRSPFFLHCWPRWPPGMSL